VGKLPENLTSALPPEADSQAKYAERLLLTQNGLTLKFQLPKTYCQQTYYFYNNRNVSRRFHTTDRYSNGITIWKQGVVYNLMTAVGGFKTIHRFLYWMLEVFVQSDTGRHAAF
jgi:hypothetical protein